MIPFLFSCHQKLLKNNLRRGRLVCYKGQLKVVDDPVHHYSVDSDEEGFFSTTKYLVIDEG